MINVVNWLTEVKSSHIIAVLKREVIQNGDYLHYNMARSLRCEKKLKYYFRLLNMWQLLYHKKGGKQHFYEHIKCVSLAMFNYLSLSYTVADFSPAATNLPVVNSILHDFPGLEM